MSSLGKSTGPCYSWVRTGICPHGNKCKFSHQGNNIGGGNAGVGGSRNAGGKTGQTGGGSSGGRGGGKGKGICYEWQRTGRCQKGKNCKFQHAGATSQSVGGKTGNNHGGNSGGNGGGRGFCHEWQRTGSCSKGNNCRFQHVGTGGQGAAIGNPRTKIIKATATDLNRFIMHLSILPCHKLGDELFKSTSLWRRCWRSHDTLDDKLRGKMVEVLAKIPGSSSVDPPAIQVLQEVIHKYLEKEASGFSTDDKVLTSVKTVRDAVSRALDFQWICPQDDVRAGLTTIIVLAEGKSRQLLHDVGMMLFR